MNGPWVVMIMALNGMGLSALNYPVLCPPNSARFALVSVILAGLNVLLAVYGRPLAGKNQAAEAAGLELPPPKEGKG